MNTKEGDDPSDKTKDGWEEEKLSMMKERESYNLLANSEQRTSELILTIIAEE